MKFGKSLSNQIEETLPEWRDKFLSYKDLKKRLKRIQPNGSNANKRPKTSPESYSATDTVHGNGKTTMTEEETDFVSLLQLELDKFNYFFLEKEEEYVIRQKELHDRMATATIDAEEEQLMKIRKEIVDFHGEMVLLENYSALNYTGLAKILKKYDKRTGTLLRLPFIRKVLQQPFYTTDLIYKLVKECESMLDRIFPIVDVPRPASVSGSAPGSVLGKRVKMEEVKNPELEEIEFMESILMKSTISALRVFKEIRSGSSTVSVFSLPPLQHNINSPEVLKTDLKI